jgi:hypothetical protein
MDTSDQQTFPWIPIKIRRKSGPYNETGKQSSSTEHGYSAYSSFSVGLTVAECGWGDTVNSRVIVRVRLEKKESSLDGRCVPLTGYWLRVG